MVPRTWDTLGVTTINSSTPVGITGQPLDDYGLAAGDSGNDVHVLQEELAAFGYPLHDTGYFGSVTRNSVKDMQSRLGMEQTGSTDESLFSSSNVVANILWP